MQKYLSLYAAPLVWGKKVQIQSVFGVSVWCRFEVVENHARAPVLFQYWSSDSKAWRPALPGQTLHGQSVWLAAKSTGTGGAIEIAVAGTAISVAVVAFPIKLLKDRSPGLRILTTITPADGEPIVVDPDDPSRDAAVGYMEDNPDEEVIIEFPRSIEDGSSTEPQDGPEGSDGPDGRDEPNSVTEPSIANADREARPI